MQFELNVQPKMAAVDPALIARQPSMSKALALCQTLSGKDDAQFYGDGGIVKDQAQWSRIMGPSNHNFPHDKLNLFMDKAGNEAPMLWLLYSRGYDITNLHLRETETERELRLAREEIARLRSEREVERRLFRDLRVAA
jgi:hypothetical protein